MRQKRACGGNPVAPHCCDHILPEVNDSVVEYGADTTRAIAKLLFTGCVVRYPKMRFIFSHAGGTMPFLIERFMRAHVSSPKIRGVLHVESSVSIFSSSATGATARQLPATR